MFAFLRRLLYRWLGRPTRRVDVQAGSLLMNQPLDILLELQDFLPPESSAALSLTCKAAFHTFFPAAKRRLDARGRQSLLLLLEESVSRDRFFCYGCTRLHRFSHSWAPSCRSYALLEPPCEPETTDFGNLCIGFYHVRLAMNTHLFGPGHGLSLSRFNIKITPDLFGWETSYEARIIQGQLFLRASHRLLLYQRRQLNRITSKYTYPHYICPHIMTNPCSQSDPAARVPTQIPQLLPLIHGFYNDDADIEDCNNAPGSCSVCLTDFTTTYKQRRADVGTLDRDMLDVTVVSYHQLGNCRSPSEWEWRTFSTRYSNHLPGTLTRGQHLGSYYKSGRVRKRWDRDSSKPVTSSTPIWYVF